MLSVEIFFIIKQDSDIVVEIKLPFV